MNSTYLKGLLFIILTALCFSVMEVLGAFGWSSGANTQTILTTRFVIATLLFGITLFIWNKKCFKIEKGDIKWFILISGIFLIETFSYWFGYKIIGQVSILLGLFYLAPVWIAIFSVLLLKTKLNKTIILSVLMGVVSVLFLSWDNSVIPSNPIGICLIILSGVLWGTFFMISQKISHKYHPFTLLFYMFLILSVCCCFIQNPAITVSQLNTHAFLYIGLMGIITTFLSYFFLQFAIRHTKALKTGILDIIEIPSILIMVFIFLGQIPNPLQLIGIAIVILNIYILGEYSNAPIRNTIRRTKKNV